MTPEPNHQQNDPQRVSTESAPGTGRKLAIAIAVLCVILLIGFIIAFFIRRHDENAANELAKNVEDAKPVVDVVWAMPSAKSYPLQLPGQTAGWDDSPIFARVDGYVAAWLVDIGDPVKQGQVLAKIDTPEIDQQLNASRAKVAASAAQVQVAESVVSIAKVTYDRWRDSPKGVVSEQEREEKKAAFEEANARLTAARAQEQLDQAEVSRYEALEGFKNLTAPYTGIITERHVNIGNLVTAGSSGETKPLYNMSRFETIRVFADVPQKAAAQVKPGLVAQVTSDQYPGRIFKGTVARASMSMDLQTRTQRTEVDIENKDLALVPNLAVQVTFELNQQGLPQVPAAAILPRPTGPQIAVVDDDDRIHFRPVTIATDNGVAVVLGTGAEVGDRVALNLSSAIVEGEEVKLNHDPHSGDEPPPRPAKSKEKAPRPQTTAPVASENQSNKSDPITGLAASAAGASR